MSIHYTTIALIGVELDINKLYQPVKERGCQHEIPLSGGNYCCICGKPIWIKYNRVIEPFADADSPGEFLEWLVYQRLELVVSSSYDDRVFLGLQASCRNWNKEVEMMSLEHVEIAQIRQSLQQFLEPLRLWDEAKFGLWAIMKHE